MSLPPGETDPNKLYIAVGRAIHAWESMEEAFARLFATMTGLPEDPRALATYGDENRRFVDRIDALRTAAEGFFVCCPDQNQEGELESLLTEAVELSIKRHRIAHGHITMWGHFKVPSDPGPFSVVGRILFRWGAPFYSTTNLRTDPVGGDAASINAAHDDFVALANKVDTFTSGLRKRPSPGKQPEE